MITIFTPVYNRAYIIENLYISLLRQTSHNFDWLIVDDGSTDNLADLVDKWEGDKKRFFQITYIYRENGGKHRAWNTALPQIKGDWTFVVDSDDYLTNDAIERIEKWILEIADDDRFAGVAGKRGSIKNQKTYPIGNFPKGKTVVNATNLERYRYNLLGDQAEVYRTSILREYPFPEFENEKFIAENAVFGRIARSGRKVRWHSDIIYICEYREDGLTKGIALDRSKYIKGYTYMVKESDKYSCFPLNFVSIGRYCVEVKLLGISFSKARELLEVNYFTIILGIVVYKLMVLRNRVFHNE